MELLLAAIILIALFFDFSNGFHDCANSVSTSIGTRAISPRSAIFMSAALNFLGPLIVGTAVAHTIGSGIVSPDFITPDILLAALAGAISWNLLTWLRGLPSSSSHALIGGLIGAVVAAQGVNAINLSGLTKIFLSLLLSPIAGIFFGLLIASLIIRFFSRRSPSKTNFLFKRLQILSSASSSLSHGANDAQKTMGIIALALYAFGETSQFSIPLWVIIACAGAMALGTACGGWRIIRTMGSRIVELKPYIGFSSEASSAIVIFTGSILGAPISTTHTVSSSIFGAGMARNVGHVHWNIVRNIFSAWFLTLPVAAVIAAAVYFLLALA